jgi:chorismate lyase / 3-hydroxybenzoate synthase
LPARRATLSAPGLLTAHGTPCPSSTVVHHPQPIVNRREAPAAVDVCEPAALAPLRPEPPAWAPRLAEARPERWTLVTEQVPDVGSFDADALEAAVAAAYRRLAARLDAEARYPVRFWNFVPDIHADMGHAESGGGLDRYMVFNAGRFAAFCDWFGPAATFNRHVPTASAVGIASPRGGDTLVIHALATTAAGVPVENPRQVPAYSYSRRYGPLPPCFARATRLDAVADEGARLFVGGTASIVGEDSQHEHDVRRQTLETFENLARLVARAREAAGPCDVSAEARRSLAKADPLDAFTDLRVYIVRDEDAPIVRELVTVRCPSLHVELAQADLCRRELLVEIEGVATL